MLVAFMRRFYMLIALAFIAVLLASYFLFKESSFQECVLSHSKGLTDDAVGLVYQMCEEKYAQKTPEINTFDLNELQLAQLTGRAGERFGDYGVDLYNGNEKITLTEVVISIIETPKKGESVTREYRNKIRIAPKSARNFSFNFIQGDVGAKYSWTIASAKGHE